jgi:DNA invertase Pin-like site-specific DNA recombinase
MLIGYARVSKTEQDPALQLDALKRASVRKVYAEKRSAGDHRPELERMLDELREGDTVTVYKLDRLARSMSDLVRILERIKDAGAGFRSLTESIDTGTPAGRMVMHMVGAFAEFERSIIRERSVAGQAAARERGARFGRPRALTPAQEAQVAKRYASGKYGKGELATIYGCSLSSIKRCLARVGLDAITAGHSHGCYIPSAGRKGDGAGTSGVRLSRS